VFPAPLACTVAAATHADAVREARAAGGPAPSIQAFNLVPKIVEAMAIVAVDDRLHEVSPELSFAVLAGAPLATRKRTAAGAAERRALLVDRFRDLVERAPGAARDDVLDAYAVAWTARRIAAGTAERLGDDDGAIWV
jgi:predicted RNase H-like nuclease